eukprot:jgi/Ulvmu1/8666/UM047_0004.1
MDAAMESCVSAQVSALQAISSLDRSNIESTHTHAEAACQALSKMAALAGTADAVAVSRRLLDAFSPSLQSSIDVAFTLFCAVFVFLMQAGFAMLCAGSVRSKNTVNILIKNVIDGCAGAVAFYAIGYGLAYGTAEDGSGNPFIGTNDFFLSQTSESAAWHAWLFQWAFAAATATIVSGSVAERCTFEAYVGYSFFLTAIVYPIAAHWVWSSNGWLAMSNTDPLFGVGVVDFAGCAVVHFVGGLSGLIGAYMLGPRMGRFRSDGTASDGFEGHNATLVVIGTFLLWVGWYGFNPGSAMAISTPIAAALVGRSAVTTTLSAGTAGIVALLDSRATRGHYNLVAVCNGILSGLVAITAGCACVEPWAAMVIGAAGALLFARADSLILTRLRIDDPLAASAMHGVVGAFGAVAVGVFAKEEYVKQIVVKGTGTAAAYTGNTAKGIIYGGNGKLLLCQIIAIVAIGAWTSVMMGLYFLLMWRFRLLRCAPEIEQAGLDRSKHGGTAYNWDDGGRRAKGSSAGQGSARQVVNVGETARPNMVVPFNEH